LWSLRVFSSSVKIVFIAYSIFVEEPLLGGRHGRLALGMIES
jgi:hypothetical protein